MMRVHLIGICGTAMATAAALLRHKGYDVRGSDQDMYPPMSEFLAAEGIATLSGYKAEHIGAELDLVIVGNAISRGNVELEEVLDRKIRYCSLPEAIREHFLWGARSIVIAGTHGKTTTTALAGWLLAHGGADPTVLVGGIARNLGVNGSSYRVGHGRDFVIEGDEYDSAFFDKTAKFLKYLPDIAVINNIEFDHADIYTDVEQVTLAFRRLVGLVPRRGLLLLGADSPRAAALAGSAPSRVATFGTAMGADWRAHDVEAAGTSTRFRLARSADDLGVFELPLVGTHNVRNAVAAIAVALEAGVDPARIAEGLQQFQGVKRRLEIVGVAAGVTIYDDFAHHPTAVAETLAGLRAAHPAARIWAVFEPRSASSCRRVFQTAFAHAFAGADEVVIAPVFRATLPESERLSIPQLVRDLRAGHQAARQADSIDAIVSTIAAERRSGDLVGTDVERRFRRDSSEVAGGAWRRGGFALMPTLHQVPLGDSAVVVHVGDSIDEAVNSRTLSMARVIEAAAVDGVRDVVPTSGSVTVYFDPLRTSRDALARALEDAQAAGPGPPTPARAPIRVPVCYEGECAPDLGGVARRARLTEAQVVDLHLGRTYRVFMLGFVPGFAYMGVLDERIAAPRLPVPRPRVPRGAVGIAGRQTGVYPSETPGGWHIIGRTPLVPFELNRIRAVSVRARRRRAVLRYRFRPVRADAFAGVRPCSTYSRPDC